MSKMIVKVRKGRDIELYAVEATSPQSACELLTALGYKTVTAWRAYMTNAVMPSMAKKVAAGDYVNFVKPDNMVRRACRTTQGWKACWIIVGEPVIVDSERLCVRYLKSFDKMFIDNAQVFVTKEIARDWTEAEIVADARRQM